MMKKLILGVTIGGSSRLLDGQAKYFRELGYHVFLISQNHYKEPIFCQKEGIEHLPVEIDNIIHPVKDLKALFQIINHFKKIKPDIVNIGTPKMGLLGIIAAWLTGVKTRIYTCRGLRFETEKGFTKWVLKVTERITVRLASKVIYVSPSLMKSAIDFKTCIPAKSVVLSNGSSNGVDLGFYNRPNVDLKERENLLEKLGIKNKLIIGFVGRISREKGSYELVEAFEKINKETPETILIMMGHILCEESFEKRFRSNPHIIHIPFQDNVPLYMSIFDLLVLPSWREGFPNVPIQAAAMGLPVIVSDATGCVDSVNNGFNGLVFPVRNAIALEKTIVKYIENSELRQQHGKNGIVWAKNFTPEIIWDGLDKLYNSNY